MIAVKMYFSMHFDLKGRPSHKTNGGQEAEEGESPWSKERPCHDLAVSIPGRFFVYVPHIPLCRFMYPLHL